MVVWNKGKRVGQKKAFKLEDIWRIRIRLELKTTSFTPLLQNNWVTDIDLDKAQCSTYSLRRIKASFIYDKTTNLCSIQLLLVHAKLESMIECLGVEIEDALRISESISTQTET